MLKEPDFGGISMRNTQFVCSECRSELDHQADFCPQCGALFRTDQDCINHEDIKATNVCVVCNKPLCYLCVTHREGTGYCRDHYPALNPTSHVTAASPDKYAVEYRMPEEAMLILKEAEQSS